MKSVIVTAALGLLAQATSSLAWKLNQRPRGIKALDHPNMDVVNNGTFDQLLDHNNPSLGTFKQRYWFDAQYWNGPGSPVFLFNPGEQKADGFTGYLNNKTITGLYAQKFGGAVVIIEHRYWGESNPMTELTTETLQYLDLPNAVWDMTYFAKNANLSVGTDTISNADQAPWVLIGGSYSGALAAWTAKIDPGVFWAYHASSAVVEAIYDFYPYFDAVAEAIPKNCSNDIKAVIQYVDSIFETGTADQIQDLKEQFGLGEVEHPDDFAEQLALPLIWWQSNETYVTDFCDYIETYAARGNVAVGHASGLGLQPALAGYASFINQTTSCSAKNPCNSYDPNINWDNSTNLSGSRQWDWMLCHQPFGWWQVGPPTNDGNTVVSSLLQPDRSERQCALKFPETNGFKVGCDEGFTTEHLNMFTGGWDATYERVMFVQGEFDPWKAATISAPRRPGGPRESTEGSPIFTVKGGNHVPDLFISSKPEIANVTALELATMEQWLGKWAATA